MRVKNNDTNIATVEKNASGYSIGHLVKHNGVDQTDSTGANSNIQAGAILQKVKCINLIQAMRPENPVDMPEDYARVPGIVNVHIDRFNKNICEETAGVMIETFRQYYQWEQLRKFRQAYKHKLPVTCEKIRHILSEKDRPQKIKISACMIVKNEAHVLHNCLDSIAGKVDELIIVDTGSTDGTQDIARRYTDKVYEFIETPFNFANARNNSIRRATNDWVLIIDADEVLKFTTSDSLQKIIEKAIRLEKDTIRIKFYEYHETGAHKYAGYSNTRIIRQDYVNITSAVHNQINGALNENSIYYCNDLEIYHSGYDMKKEKRQQRNQDQINALLVDIKDIEEKGIDNVQPGLYALKNYLLGRHLLIAGDHAGAMVPLNIAYDKKHRLQDNLRITIISLVALAMIDLRKAPYEQFLGLIKEAQNEFGTTDIVDLQYYTYLRALHEGKHKEALQHARAYLRGYEKALLDTSEIAYTTVNPARKKEILDYIKSRAGA